MTVHSLRAAAHPDGGRIDLSWEGTSPSASVALLRCDNTYPRLQDLDSSARIATLKGKTGYCDTDVRAETVYYYGVVELSASGQGTNLVTTSAMATGSYESAALAYRMLPAIYRRMDELQVHGADERLAAADRAKGPLRRYLDLFGGQLDLIRSHAAAARNFSDSRQVDGALLPLLAQWIGWKTDFASPLAQQRNAVRVAPELYRTTGTAANLRAVVSRFSTWEVRVKEFAQSIAFTNQPEGLAVHEVSTLGPEAGTLRAISTDYAFDGSVCLTAEQGGLVWLLYHAWVAPTSQSAASRTTAANGSPPGCQLMLKRRRHDDWLASRRLAPARKEDQRHPCAVARPTGGLQVFWIASRSLDGQQQTTIEQCALAYGRDATPARVSGTPLSSVAIDEDDALTVTVAGVTRTVAFARGSRLISATVTPAAIAEALDRELPSATVLTSHNGALILVTKAVGGQASLHIAESALANKLGVATTAQVFGESAMPARLVGEVPSSSQDAGLLRVYVNDGSAIQVELPANASLSEVCSALNAKSPGLASAAEGALVLTSPTVGDNACVRVDIDPDNTLAPAFGFGGALRSLQSTDAEPKVTEPAVARDAQGRIWMFYAARLAGRWQVCYRVHQAATWTDQAVLSEDRAREPSVMYDAASDALYVFWSGWNGTHWTVQAASLDSVGTAVLDDLDWHFFEPFPSSAQRHNRREPKPCARTDSGIQLLFSADAIDGWKIWTCTIADGHAQNERQLTDGPYTQRGAAGLTQGEQQLLVCRTNAATNHSSRLYPGLKTLDCRLSGTTSIDTHNQARTRTMKAMEDLVHYTCDARSATGLSQQERNTIWYARNVVGIYLVPDTQDPRLIVRRREILEAVLRDFLPIQVRPVFIVDPAAVREYVYDYDNTSQPEPHYIEETTWDALAVEHKDVLPLAREHHRDHVLEWICVHTWSASHVNHLTVDIQTTPVALNFRTWREDLVEVEPT